MIRFNRSARAVRLAWPDLERRSVTVAYLLWALGFLGLIVGLPGGLNGIHRFYCRKPASGAVWLVTLGLCGVGQLIDLLLIPSMVREANQPLELRLAQEALANAGGLSLEQHLLRLARRCGAQGFTINDALVDAQLPPGSDSESVRLEIQRLLHGHLLDVGNDETGRVVYREP